MRFLYGHDLILLLGGIPRRKHCVVVELGHDRSGIFYLALLLVIGLPFYSVCWDDGWATLGFGAANGDVDGRSL